MFSKSFFQLKKDYEEYEKYQKREAKEEQKIQETLKKINVSNEQLKEAKSLQKNAFMSFEKMDEMTQRYVDDTEAATDIGKQYINSATNFIGTLISLVLMSKPSKNGDATKDLLIKSIPMFAPIIIQVPTAIEAAQIKKEAGKIGTMKAMQDLQDSRYFVQNEN